MASRLIQRKEAERASTLPLNPWPTQPPLLDVKEKKS